MAAYFFKRAPVMSRGFYFSVNSAAAGIIPKTHPIANTIDPTSNIAMIQFFTASLPFLVKSSPKPSTAPSAF
jgi:hypothetical protein